MTTVSTAEAIETLPTLLERSRDEKVAIRTNGEELVYLVSSQQLERDRIAKIEAFERLCQETSAELERNLAAEGITVEEFMADVLKDM